MKGMLFRIHFILHPSSFILPADALPDGRASAMKRRVLLLVHRWRAGRRLLARRDRRAVEADGVPGLFAVGLGVVHRVRDLHASRDAAEGGEGAVEVRAVADEDEEVRGGAVRLV